MNFSEIGVEGYFFNLKPSGGKLRKDSEDFYVEEEFDEIDRKDDGKVLILRIRAKNWEHNRLVRFIARSNRVSPKRVYFAGTKDRRSVKIQYFSIPGVKYREFSLNDVEILDHFYLDYPLTIGSHSRNHFKIRVSDCDSASFLSNCEALNWKGIVPNYYGPQRFGPLRPVTHLVGREIVRGNYEEAVRIFVGYPGEDRFAVIRKEFYENPDPETNLRNFPESLDLEIKVMDHLIHNKADYAGAIKELPDNLVSMFIHAYQGYLFNKMLSKRLEISKTLVPGDIFRIDDETVKINSLNIEKMEDRFKNGNGSPTGLVVGYATETARGAMGDIENEVLNQENLKQIDFKLPFGLSSRGERRDLYLRFNDLRCSGCDTEFSLPPGAYATSLLRELMRTDEMANY